MRDIRANSKQTKIYRLDKITARNVQVHMGFLTAAVFSNFADETNAAGPKSDFDIGHQFGPTHRRESARKYDSPKGGILQAFHRFHNSSEILERNAPITS